jgi:probable rRNA maturation factor
VHDFAGDVAISAEIAAQNARRLGHSLPEEIKILALHGVLHLAGYDHERDRGEMARKEEHLRKQLGLPVALIERTFTAPRHDTAIRRSPRTPAPTAKRSSSFSVLAKGRSGR